MDFQTDRQMDDELTPHSWTERQTNGSKHTDGQSTTQTHTERLNLPTWKDGHTHMIRWINTDRQIYTHIHRQTHTCVVIFYLCTPKIKLI